MNIEYKNYCIVCLGNTDGVLLDLHKLAENEPSVVESSNLFIASFISVMSINELKEYFNVGNKRTFFIFELDSEVNAWHIDVDKLHNKLFKDVDEMDKSVLNEMSNHLMGSINKSLNTSGNSLNYDSVEIVEEIDTLSDKEILDKVNEFLDLGVDNLSLKQRGLLDELSKKLK